MLLSGSVSYSFPSVSRVVKNVCCKCFFLSFAIENPVSRGMLYGWSELDTVHEMTMTMASFLFEFDAIPTWCHTSKCCSAG